MELLAILHTIGITKTEFPTDTFLITSMTISPLDGANSVTLSSDGKHAYVTGSSGYAVSWYERNASTGALSYGGMLKDGVGGVDGLDGATEV